MKISSLVVVLSLSAALVGCGKDLESYARYFEKKVGIPVELHSTDADLCLVAQLEKFYAEYKALSRSQQSQAREVIQGKYQTIHLNATEVSQVIRGQIDTLVYYRRVCGDSSCRNDAIGSKVLAENLTAEGEKPVTRLTKASSLSITPSTLRNEALRKDYWTADVTVYDRADALDDVDFIAGRQSGSIWLNDEAAMPIVTCGESVGLTSLLN